MDAPALLLFGWAAAVAAAAAAAVAAAAPTATCGGLKHAGVHPRRTNRNKVPTTSDALVASILACGEGAGDGDDGEEEDGGEGGDKEAGGTIIVAASSPDSASNAAAKATAPWAAAPSRMRGAMASFRRRAAGRRSASGHG